MSKETKYIAGLLMCAMKAKILSEIMEKKDET